MTERSVDRMLRILALAAIVVVIGVAGYYAYDRYGHRQPSATEQMLQQLEGRVIADPNDVAARAVLAEAYAKTRAYDKAIEQYREVLSAQESNQTALFGIAVAHVKKDEGDKAIDYLNKIVELNKESDFILGNRLLQGAYYYLGRIYLEQENLDLAAENLKSALAVNRGDADAMYLLGNVFYAQGKYEGAADLYRLAVSYVPDFLDPYNGLLKTYEKMGDSARAGYPRGMIAWLNGDRAKGISELQATVAQVKDDAALLALGSLLEEDGKNAEALSAYQQAVEANPNNRLAKDGVQRLGKR